MQKRGEQATNSRMDKSLTVYRAKGGQLTNSQGYIYIYIPKQLRYICRRPRQLAPFLTFLVFLFLIACDQGRVQDTRKMEEH